MKNVKEMSTAELIAEYNKVTGKTIKKFSSRAAGEAQVAKLHATAKPASSSANRSEATAESWKDKTIAAKRKERTHVRVSGEEYRSVADAFRALRLPMAKVIPFRMALKAEGRKTFTYNSKDYIFTVTKAA